MQSNHNQSDVQEFDMRRRKREAKLSAHQNVLQPRISKRGELNENGQRVVTLTPFPYFNVGFSLHIEGEVEG